MVPQVSLGLAQQRGSSRAFSCLRQQPQPAARCQPSSTRSGQPTATSRRRVGPSGTRARRRISAATNAIAVPGPLFMSENFDRDRLRDSKTSLQHSGSFLQFPIREDGSELRRTPPLVR